MRILLAGASGTLGSALTHHLNTCGHTTVALVRKPTQSPTEIHWNPYAAQPLPTHDFSPLENFDATICLSGEDISAHRWTKHRREQLRSSRLTPINTLGRIFAQLKHPPSILITASGANYYEPSSVPLTEGSPSGNSFLASLCREWEAAAFALATPTLRVTPIRFGAILTPTGGMLKKLLPIFRLGLGGPIGSGHQHISWITLHDACRTIEFTLTHTFPPGAINGTAPNPVTNAEFTNALARALNRPAIIPVPAFALQLAFGKMANEVLLADLPVVPACLTAANFRHTHPTIAAALADILH
jgi:uncharacterized protein (TIGR01777 family)